MKIKILYIAILSLLAIAQLSVGREHMRPQSINAEIDSLTVAVMDQKDEAARVNGAFKILSIISELGQKQIRSIDARSIDSISRLLADRNDAIKSYAAKALGVMGGQAKAALPALKKALENATPIQGSGVILPAVGPSDDIRNAIARIECAKP